MVCRGSQMFERSGIVRGVLRRYGMADRGLLLIMKSFVCLRRELDIDIKL
jgi:hypothetical protein